jgi:hypothetical protein
MMHNVLINIVPTIFDIWIGGRSSQATADGPLLSKSTLNSINQQLQNDRKNIPAKLGRLPSTFNHKGNFIAVEWRMILEYMLPMFEGHLEDEVLENMKDLRTLWNLSTQVNITRTELRMIGTIARRFVQVYEELYYAGNNEYLHSCFLGNHWLLHLQKMITAIGPASYWWAFPMERFCFLSRGAATSPRHIAKAMFNSMYNREMFNMIDLEMGIFSAPPIQEPIRLLEPINLESRRHRTRPVQVPISTNIERQLCISLGIDPASIDISYFRKCKLDYTRDSTVIGSLASQLQTLDNRKDCFVAFHDDERIMKFGTVATFVSVAPQRICYAVVQTWHNVVVHENRYAAYSTMEGAWQLTDIGKIVCLVGSMVSRVGRRRRNLVIGAPQEFIHAGPRA